MIIIEHNVETGEVIERKANAEEIAQVESDKAEIAQRQLDREAKAEAKSALLEKLGITEDEAKLLLA